MHDYSNTSFIKIMSNSSASACSTYRSKNTCTFDCTVVVSLFSSSTSFFVLFFFFFFFFVFPFKFFFFIAKPRWHVAIRGLQTESVKACFTLLPC